MKKMFTMILAALMVFALTMGGAKEAAAETVGGWTLTGGEITQEAQSAFDKAGKTLLGAEYQPIALLGTQLVSGMNYCFLCEAAVVYPGGEPYYVLMYIYQNLQGEAEVTKVVDLDIAALSQAEPEDGEDPEAYDPSYYSSVTPIEKAEVEEFCQSLCDAYLNEDWDVIAQNIRYPITVDGTELGTAEEFLAFMQDKTVAEFDREAIFNENCRNMFLNGQGICLGSGQIWVHDPSYMTDKESRLEIIALSGITGK